MARRSRVPTYTPEDFPPDRRPKVVRTIDLTRCLLTVDQIYEFAKPIAEPPYSEVQLWRPVGANNGGVVTVTSVLPQFNMVFGPNPNGVEFGGHPYDWFVIFDGFFPDNIPYDRGLMQARDLVESAVRKFMENYERFVAAQTTEPPPSNGGGHN